MRRFQLVVACAVAVMAVTAAGAGATTSSAAPCSTGTLESGTYAGFTVTGTCFPAPGATIRIRGNLMLAPGAVFNDHAGVPASIHISGNVTVGSGAVLGLGSYDPGAQQRTTVDGNVVANSPKSLYLSLMTIRGNLVSNGGGDPTLNFPIKDVRVRGNVVIQGWHGLWIGLLRATVGGNVVIANNVAADTSELPGKDSTEIVDNDIGGNLVCYGNTPHAQLGDSGQPDNRVRGNTVGECVNEPRLPSPSEG